MSGEDDEDPFVSLVESYIQTQGSTGAIYHIVMELTLMIAMGQPDPPKFLKSMFEAISAKLDQTPLKVEKKRASAEVRLTLSTFFSVLDRAVRDRASKPSGRAPRPG